jgi:hypothetical protein
MERRVVCDLERPFELTAQWIHSWLGAWSRLEEFRTGTDEANWAYILSGPSLHRSDGLVASLDVIRRLSVVSSDLREELVSMLPFRFVRLALP